jgi:hypothetical protein
MERIRRELEPLDIAIAGAVFGERYDIDEKAN